MTPAELTQLEAQAHGLFFVVRSLYWKIPKAMREKRKWADMKGYYEDGWPDPKPESVIQFLAAYEAWTDVWRKVHEAQTPNLKLSKVRRTP